jgi:tRNA threonylcarbamoyladenosine biosynthesis protein TsaE
MESHHKPPLRRFLPADADTLALGAALARGFAPGLVIYLSGALGAGKTTLVRGALQALGETGHIKSPTFALVEPYKFSSLYLYHFDFYRFKSADELDDAGFRDYFSQDAVALVEWPEKAGSHLPPPDLTIALALEGEGRSVSIAAHTEAGTHCLERIEH